MADSKLKKIEYAFKSWFDKLLDSKTQPILINKAQNVFNLKDNHKILLLRHDRIGDVIISTPLINQIREKLPNSEIDILLSEKNISSKNAVAPYIDNIYIYKKNIFSLLNLIRILKSKMYDLVIDLFDNPSSTSGFLIKLIKSRYSLGLDKQNSSIYSHIVPLLDKKKYHIVERILQLLLPFGLNPDAKSCFLQYPISNDDKINAEMAVGKKHKSLRLGINIAGSSEEKFWGTAQYIEFIKRFIEKHKEFEVVIFGTNHYLEIINKIHSSTSAIIAPTDKSFHQYAAMLSLCDLILTVDTAAVHLASAFRIPCVALYTITGKIDEPIPWYPYNSPHRILTTIGELNQIKVTDVLNSIEELL